MTQAIATQKQQTSTDAIEKALIGGDLSALTPDQRLSYYKQTCESLGLNPLTKPFEYVKLNNKLTLYARKDATDQLRNVNHISIEEPKIQFEGDWIIVTVVARTPEGRTDSDIGAVKKTDMQGNFGNALMKAVTKSKRRVTLSICGLGMLDETEVETIPQAQTVPVEVAEATTEADPNAEQYLAIKTLCKELNAANDSIVWKSKTLADYACEILSIEKYEDAEPDQLEALIADLTQRLDDLR
jgi:hypothetical protein